MSLLWDTLHRRERCSVYPGKHCPRCQTVRRHRRGNLCFSGNDTRFRYCHLQRCRICYYYLAPPSPPSHLPCPSSNQGQPGCSLTRKLHPQIHSLGPPRSSSVLNKSVKFQVSSNQVSINRNYISKVSP